jgi:hypothetical protein
MNLLISIGLSEGSTKLPGAILGDARGKAIVGSTGDDQGTLSQSHNAAIAIRFILRAASAAGPRFTANNQQ